MGNAQNQVISSKNPPERQTKLPGTLPRIIGVRIELSVVKCYEEEPSMLEMVNYLYSLGFRLCAIDEAWSDSRTREVFQVDGVFFRVAALKE